MALASYYQIKAAEPAVRVFYILRSLHLWARTDSGVTPKRAFNNSTQIIKAITNKKNVHAPSKTPTANVGKEGEEGRPERRRGGLDSGGSRPATATRAASVAHGRGRAHAYDGGGRAWRRSIGRRGGHERRRGDLDCFDRGSDPTATTRVAAPTYR